MKLSLILGLIFITSCGKVTLNQADPELGQETQLQTVTVDQTLTDSMSVLCSSLEAKESTYKLRFANNQYRFNFQTSYTTCDGVETKGTVSLGLRDSYTGGLDFYSPVPATNYFSQLETTKSGILSQVCQHKSDATQPFVVNEQTAIKVQIASSLPGCQAQANTICVKVNSMFKQVSGLYKTILVDTYRVSLVSGNNYGLELMHSRTDAGFCGEGKSTSQVQTFQSISN